MMEFFRLLPMRKPDCSAKFAGRTENAAGKLSFMERDVSFSFIIDPIGLYLSDNRFSVVKCQGLSKT
jgi:hypothetical protein